MRSEGYGSRSVCLSVCLLDLNVKNALSSCPAEGAEFKQSILSRKHMCDFVQQAVVAEINQHLSSLLLRAAI